MADLSDRAAYDLLKRIAEKTAEPLDEAADPNKTLGECREELFALLREAQSFVMRRNVQGQPHKD